MAASKVRHHILSFLDTISVGSVLDLDGLQLRPPEHAELVEVFNLAGFGTRHDAAMYCEAVIDGAELTSDENDSVLGDRAGALITALRIWTGLPIASIATYNAPNVNALRGTIRPSRKSWLDKTTAAPLSDPDGFVEFYRRVRDVLLRPPEALAVALRRLQLMVEQERGGDRLLDLYIILEALFQLGDEKQELAYRLSLRTAHFVGTDLSSRKQINKTIKTGYGLRSRIAHGSRPDSEDEELQETIEKIVMEALRRYCQRAAAFANDKAHKAVIEEIDGYLLERRSDA